LSFVLFFTIIIFDNLNIIIRKERSVYQSQAVIFKALMHTARLEILNELRSGEHCVCHLEAMLGYRQSYISQHLSVLKEAGVIEDRRDGWNVYYRVATPQVFALLDTAMQISPITCPEEEPKTIKKRQPCPCPQCNPAGERAEC
jgi:ArsR family transcriptional regulator